ncbi:sulfatase-like hydrolase/transferase [Microlunatus elymi]|uniref:Sulfatase-like hydrolase/transferase n=1 Tax=Microlunatus elymi TaxID=2596828 RepID=A0A516Q1X9_9ACTN|nr:sulfatase-like hydrolase/transferase [Microlunatus elymi]QDP97382.1 sulfatase-like hydrolase/transferase [Microlunatus elymi]
MSSASPADRRSRRRPNVVIVYTDDLGYGDLGCYGADDLATPHLDALAERGVRATSWYSNAPVCSPSRAALLTGRHPINTGVTHILGGRRSTPGLSNDQPTLMSILAEQGYHTGIFGKWHLGLTPDCRPRSHGFEEFFGFLAGCVDYYSHIFYWGQGDGTDPLHDLWENETEVWHNGEYLTELITDRAVDFIERHADQPFFCYLPYNAPHYPMHAPQHYLDRFADLPADRRIMAAMIAAVDDGVGRVVETLREQGLLDDTVIIFSSDNGPSAESRNWLDGNDQPWRAGTTGGYRGYKGSLFDGGIREPFLISYPAALPAGRVVDAPAQMSDVVPTVLSLLGIETTDLGPGIDFDGRDVSGLLAGTAESPHQQLVWSQDNQLAIREGDWKLITNPCLDFDRVLPDPVWLSDLADDPYEQTNLADDHPETVRRLLADVSNWHSSITG